MPPKLLLDVVPIWAVLLGTVVMVLLAVEIGYQLGARRRRQPTHEAEAPVGAIAGASLGLLAFMLAFTFGMAAGRFETRKQLVLDEANAVGTCFLRAEVLPKPHSTAVGKLLREYVDVRLSAIEPDKLEAALRRSEEIHGELWQHAVGVGTEHPNSIVVGLFVQSLNEVIDLHAKRVTAAFLNRIPPTIWIVLCGVSVLAMAAIGYHMGLAGGRNVVANVALVLAFSAVIFLIVSLDRPGEGPLPVSQQALINLHTQLSASGR